jgi:Flp pilus assembly protein TadD
LYQRSDRLALALEYLQEAARLNPGYAETHNNLGIVLARLDRLDEAIVQFNEALTLRPNYPDAGINLAHAIAEQRQMKQAPSN